jgi:hypothetical protein
MRPLRGVAVRASAGIGSLWVPRHHDPPHVRERREIDRAAAAEHLSSSTRLRRIALLASEDRKEPEQLTREACSRAVNLPFAFDMKARTAGSPLHRDRSRHR